MLLKSTMLHNKPFWHKKTGKKVGSVVISYVIEHKVFQVMSSHNEKTGQVVFNLKKVAERKKPPSDRNS